MSLTRRLAVSVREGRWRGLSGVQRGCLSGETDWCPSVVREGGVCAVGTDCRVLGGRVRGDRAVCPWADQIKWLHAAASIGV